MMTFDHSLMTTIATLTFPKIVLVLVVRARLYGDHDVFAARADVSQVQVAGEIHNSVMVSQEHIDCKQIAMTSHNRYGGFGGGALYR